MRTSIKAALAASAGASLLLGGAGSLAYWNDTTQPLSNTTVTSGTLDLGAPSCGDWLLDDDSVFDPGAETIVPGDSLTRVCQFQVSITGDHLEAEITANAPTMTNSALEDELSFAAVYEQDDDNTDNDTGETVIDPDAGPVAFDVDDNGDYLRVEFTVTFPFNATPTALDNDSEGGITTQLNAITVTATQTDSH